MLANKVSVNWGMPIIMPYVAIHAAFDCISPMLMPTFFWKSKAWLITSSNCTNMSFADGPPAPLIATFINSKSVKSSMLLWFFHWRFVEWHW